MIDRSKARDTPSHPAVFDTDNLFGTRVAKTILASGHVRPHKQAAHMIASDPIKPCINSCKPGAVHIWMAASRLRQGFGGQERVHSAAVASAKAARAAMMGWMAP